MNPCVEPGCPGFYEDGWCNVCGSPEPSQVPETVTPTPAQAMAPTGADPGEETGNPASAAPNVATPAPGRSTRAVRAAVVRRQRAQAAQRRSRLGMGLTQVAPVPTGDPTRALMTDPVVPEERRVCPNCGAKVGQAAGEAGGRQQGFCPQCRAPYSFTPKLAPGDLVAGQYEVVGALAHGGLGWIYLARDKNVSDRWVVLKGLLNTGDADALAAAVAEQQFLAQVKHPLIVEIYNVVTHDGDAYTVMEYVGGTSLKQMLKERMARRGRYDAFPVDQALAFVLDSLPAFSHLHDLGLLYCDFKPDNLIQEGDAVKLIDLGGVRRQDDLESPIYGTVGYQAPEVAEVGPSVASDIWTIGRTLCVLTFEFRGYQSEYAASLPPVSEVPPFQEHDAFYRLVARCCAPDPNDRFLTVEELRLQMIGVLRQVVAAGATQAATLSAHSTTFEPPVATAETLSWWELPALSHDESDPQMDWVASLPAADPIALHAALLQAAEVTPEVLVARAHAGIRTGQQAWFDEAVRGMIEHDPWDWRASWLRGLWALSQAGEAPDSVRAAGQVAAGHFSAVRDALPGEVAPRLALALASELGGYSKAAELDYERVWRTDAGYVAPAAFGLYRVRRARDDEDGAIAALDSVPASSRAHPRARWLRAELLRQRGSLADLRESVHGVSRLTLDPRQRSSFNVTIYEQALRQVDEHGEQPGWRLGEVPVTHDGLRRALEKEYRYLADYTPDPLERAALIDRANAVRPWSWT
ncbi:tetratricopeptide repeat protein [Ornithinimicrobium tianjinense]|uniref:non-specific serine/threonine protein kinase n=1 Tax=Ornithinimicrobium tianjinense TaxID=1195761 RepID=A0A917F367_9MICO|nr:tetratricopeptide repeat protein [Ornithinimicrobium tianjinense]GGF44221.1 putative serine/threonine-protein kinase [Ornithinimicrobium tianjinense]